MRRAGFTIVELLIVIVVIGILALIGVSTFANKQSQALDGRRIDDINRIRKGLELFRADVGRYPDAFNSNYGGTVGPGNGWEVSVVNPDNFLWQLKPYMGGTIPVDPVNDTSHFYYYYHYRNNHPFCDTRPNCYVLGIARLDATSALTIPGVNRDATDTWRYTSASRAVWRNEYD